MCDKCVDLDKKIDHYASLGSFMTDPQTIEGINKLIEEMKAQKVQLHPESQE
jgi:hypothetical protein